MTRRFSTIASICLACAIPLVVIAEPQGPKRGPGERSGAGGPGGNAEWLKSRAQAEEFYQKHAPNRWREFEKQRDRGGPDSKSRMMMGMVTKYQGLQLQKEDKELYPIRIRQIEVEDREYGLVIELNKADKADKEKIEKLTDDLRANAKQSIALRLEERGIRLNRLTKFVEKEKLALDTDSKNESGLIDERVKLMTEEGPEFFNPKRMRRGEGASTTPTTHSASEAR